MNFREKLIKTILFVFGTRPEAIKLAPVIFALRAKEEFFKTLVCVTGQHREMLYSTLEVLEITPDINLDVMSGNQGLNDLLASVILGVNEVLVKLKPDLVIVHGDTTSALGASLAAFNFMVPLAHVESGLRTRDLSSPFPEEANRQVIDRLSSLHFAPTNSNRENLLREDIEDDLIFVTGNTGIDSIYWFKKTKLADPDFVQRSHERLSKYLDFSIKDEKFILVTLHRRESFGAPIIGICLALREIAIEYPNIYFVFPVHLNPNISSVVHATLEGIPNVKLISPLGYFDFLFLLHYCCFIVTDSGGIQEEAPVFEKKVLLIRNNTERSEGVKSGIIELVGTNPEAIKTSLIKRIVDFPHMDRGRHLENSFPSNPFGDGKASDCIVEVLYRHFSENNAIDE